jgi:hypothetical protein
MALPDIESVADALDGRPHDFFFQDGCLYQKSDRVRFIIYPGGLVAAESEADGRCRLLSPQDASRLLAAFEEWQRNWIAARVNNVFARQLRRAGIWRRLWHNIEDRLPERRGERALAVYARAFAGDEFVRPAPNGEPPSRHRSRPQRPTPGGNAVGLRWVLHLIV